MLLNEPLQAVVVSHHYGDYLDVSLSHNRKFFDHCVVVTTPEDKESQRVAGKHACTLVITRDGLRDGTFNKGAMVERGLQQLPGRGWRMQIDADILFPGNLLQRLALALHDRSCLYGMDRFNVVGWDNYQKLLGLGFTACGFEHHHFLLYPPGAFEMGARLIFHDQGWLPLGFAQAWHSSVELTGIYRTLSYPLGSNSAAHDDIQLSLRFDRSKRVLIPEVMAAHLVTDDMKHGMNWTGRKSKPFGPPGRKSSKNVMGCPSSLPGEQVAGHAE